MNNQAYALVSREMLITSSTSDKRWPVKENWIIKFNKDTEN